VAHRGPLRLSREQIDNAGDTAIKALRDNQERLTTGALSTAATLPRSSPVHC